MKDTHLKINCFEVSQGPIVKLYLGKVSFADLKDLYTVSPRQPRADDPYLADEQPAEAKSFQRRPDDTRIGDIKRFIRERLSRTDPTKKEAIFPGVVILGLLVDIQSDSEIADPAAAQLVRASGTGQVDVLVPKRAGSLFVIDGQHRLNGLKALIDELETDVALFEENQALESLAEARQLLARALQLDIPVTLLVDFDLVEQSIVFATVNFKQKSVQRSFYYDIFGAFESDAVTPLSFSHELAIHLNNFSGSPLKGMIKLLGTGPGLISQAFIVERLIPLVDPQLERAVFNSYLARRRGGDLDGSRFLAQILRNFFQALKDSFSYAWPIPTADGYSARKYEFILCKSMFISGFLAVLREIYKLVVLDFGPADEFDLVRKNVLVPELFAELLSSVDTEVRSLRSRTPDEAREIALSKSMFSKNSKYGVGGSGKIERLIYIALRDALLGRYRELVQDPNSRYSRLIASFNGPKRAAALLDSDNFWAATEERWLTLHSPAVSPGQGRD